MNDFMKTLTCSLALFLFLATAQATEVGLRIRFGLTDKESTKWDGSVTVQPGRVANLSGWRFEQADAVQGASAWTASTHPATTVRRANQPKKAKAKAAATGPLADNGVVLSLADVTEDSRVEVKTAKGNFSFKLSDVPYGKVVEQLAGAAEVERVATAEQLSGERTDDDFPAIATGADGSVYVAYVSYTPGIDRDERGRQWDKEPADLSFLNKPSGGDQLWLRALQGGKWSAPLAVTPGKGDLYKCAVAVDGQGNAWLFWSEQKKNGNFDIWARSFKNGRLSDAQQLTSAKGNDICPVAATDAKGRVWVAWQGARKNVFCILARHQKNGGGWTEETEVSSQKRNCWSAAIATTDTAGGRVAIAWDTYDKGDYDVWVREFDAAGKADAPRPAANSALYEARPSLTYDHDGSLWIAWEESGATWGKDWGALVLDKGIPLYASRQIGLRVLRNGQWMESSGAFTQALPGGRPQRGVRRQRVPALEPESETRKAAEEAETAASVAYNNLARIATDRDGRIWLFCRSRQNDFRSPLGSVWMNYATFLDGKQWVGPILVPHSDNLLYNVPAVAAAPDGGLIFAHSTDHRQDRHVVRRGQAGNAALGADKDLFDNDVYISRLAMTGKPAAADLKVAGKTAAAQTAPSAATTKELEDVARSRGYRANVGGKDLRILRGEFHRHTEISGDGGNDGPLEDMWRYAMDVASFDWIGCGDHDNGNGREYTWWLTQKTTDAFHLPGSFDPMFTYERSVRYPEGHRNIVFAQRGVRTLPRLPITGRDEPGHAPDTQMLYKYLHLFDGVCASHTSATGMGTDWRDNDPVVEPMVEIYQGCRQNYERPGAPRSPSADDAIGGWEPKGFINLALLKGYKFAFQSSSDHRSTHISYCLVYAEDATREAIHKAMKARHVYGATDNIIADVRCKAGGKEHMLGDEFSTTEAPTLKVHLHGTGPFAKVVIVKDDEYVHSIEPKKAQVDFTWTDPKPSAGKTSYYYVRGEQADGELVWASPMWITYQPKK